MGHIHRILVLGNTLYAGQLRHDLSPLVFGQMAAVEVRAHNIAERIVPFVLYKSGLNPGFLAGGKPIAAVEYLILKGDNGMIEAVIVDRNDEFHKRVILYHGENIEEIVKVH
jgi:hypothetical protein